jgi:SAM-dependent methyltransferase
MMTLDQICLLTPEQVRNLSPDVIQEINEMGWNLLTRSGKEGVDNSLPIYGPWIATEDELKIFKNIEGKSILDLGCGKGGSLEYLAKQGAGELFGSDISSERIKQLLANPLFKEENFVVLPMECDLKRRKFVDIVIAMYSLGYTSNIRKTLELSNSYLKKKGKFIMSWIHPIFSCVSIENGLPIIKYPYFIEGPTLLKKGPNKIPVILERFKIETLVKYLHNTGFAVFNIFEPDPIKAEPGTEITPFYSKEKQIVPNTLIIEAMKVREV